MPMTDNQRETLRLWRENGENFTDTANQLGKTRQSVQGAVKAGLKWEAMTDGQAEAIDKVGLGIEEVDGGWRIIETKREDGTVVRDSVRWSVKGRDNVDPVSLADMIRDALVDIAPAIPMPAPAGVSSNLCAVFPVADLHMGLLTDEEEVGVDWDTKTAMRVFEDTFGKLVARTPSADTAILAQLGDLTHNDDQRNVTPQSGHQLDVDSRYFMIVRRAVAVMKWAIDTLRQRYGKVIYRGCRGNHDMTTHIAVTIALAEHYRDVPEVEIVDSASEFYVHQFGTNMFVFHHGDKAKPERLLPFVANEYAPMWGATKHRVTFSGHVHHEWVKEMAGMCFRSVGTIIPRDVHAFSNAYGSNRCLLSLTYDHDAGEIATARVNL